MYFSVSFFCFEFSKTWHPPWTTNVYYHSHFMGYKSGIHHGLLMFKLHRTGVGHKLIGVNFKLSKFHLNVRLL